jgi:ABC-type nitrate/sulfonate/bicarbonate transport system substrate-binding protein
MRPRYITLVRLALLVAVLSVFCGCRPQTATTTPALPTVKVGIAPYQDMALLMNVAPLGLDKKEGIRLELLSMVWQDLTPAVASATPSVDVVFASLTQFVSQEHALNEGSSDPIVFFYPAYVFKGGAFVSFNKNVPALTRADLADQNRIKRFLRFRFAAQKTSSYEMLLSELGRRGGLTLKEIKLTDMGAEDGLLAAENGSVDATSAGLTQKNEALNKGGHVVLEMADMGQVDIAGFIAKRSTLEKRRKEIAAFLKVWPEACAYTLTDIPNHSKYPLDYLRQKSSTQYTVEQFTKALSEEYLPVSIGDLWSKVVAPTAEFDYRHVVETTVAYYLQTGQLKEPPKNIDILDVK